MPRARSLRTLRRWTTLGLFALTLAAAVPAAAQETTPVATPGVPEPVELVALITPASRTNQGWDQQAADAIEAVAEEGGFTAEVAENAGYDDITPILRDLQANGADLIICHASGYQTVCPPFAAEEGVRVAVVENPAAAVPGLVADIETEAQEAAYLAGVLAALTTTSGRVGIVASGEPPTWNLMTVGFAEGVAATDPEVDLIYAVIGEDAYEDAAGAKRVTEQQLAAGADVIFGMGDGASFGMIQAIEEHNGDLDEGAAPAWFIDVIGDKREQHADVLLTSVLFDYTGLYAEMVADIERGTFGKVYTLSVASGGVSLLDLPESVPAETATAVLTAETQILAGAIEVSRITDAEGVADRLSDLFPDK